MRAVMRLVGSSGGGGAVPAATGVARRTASSTRSVSTAPVSASSSSPSSTRTAYFMELEERFGAHNYHPLPVVLSRAKGVLAWDVDDLVYYGEGLGRSPGGSAALNVPCAAGGLGAGLVPPVGLSRCAGRPAWRCVRWRRHCATASCHQRQRRRCALTGSCGGGSEGMPVPRRRLMVAVALSGRAGARW